MAQLKRTGGRAERELDLQRERFSLLERAVLLAVLARLRRRSTENSILVSLRQVLVRRSRDQQPVRDVLRHVQDLAVRAALKDRDQAVAASALGIQAGGRDKSVEEKSSRLTSEYSFCLRHMSSGLMPSPRITRRYTSPS